MADESFEGALTEEVRDALVARLSGANRRQRQDAAHRIALIAKEDAELVSGVAEQLVDALGHSEAQTRWECLDALSEVMLIAPDLVFGAEPFAEEAVFDEGSTSVRVAGFRYLCRYGACSIEHSCEVWPILNDAIQCYHGDSEYRDMLQCLVEFSRGAMDEDVRRELMERMRFDAKHSRGSAKIRALEIIDIIQKG